MKINKGDFVAIGVIYPGTFGGAEKDFKIGIIKSVLENENSAEVMFLPWGKDCSGYEKLIDIYPLDRIRPAVDIWPCMKGMSVNFS